MAEADPVLALKRQLGDELAKLLADWPRWDVAVRLGVHASRISELRRGKLERFSLDTLIRYLVALRQRVTIAIVPDRERRRPRASQARPCQF